MQADLVVWRMDNAPHGGELGPLDKVRIGDEISGSDGRWLICECSNAHIGWTGEQIRPRRARRLLPEARLEFLKLQIVRLTQVYFAEQARVRGLPPRDPLRLMVDVDLARMEKALADLRVMLADAADAAFGGRPSEAEIQAVVTGQAPSGFAFLPVLDYLVGQPWSLMALNLVASLRPSAVRVVKASTVTLDARGWRVTVMLEEDDRTIRSIHQEVSVGLVGTDGQGIDAAVRAMLEAHARTHGSV